MVVQGRHSPIVATLTVVEASQGPVSTQTAASSLMELVANWAAD